MSRKTLTITAVGLAVGFLAGGMLRSFWMPGDFASRTHGQLQESAPDSLDEPALPIADDEAKPSLEDVLSARHDAEQFHLLGRFLPGASIEDLERIVDNWGRHYHWSSHAGRNKWELLLARWIELDPRGAFDCLENLKVSRSIQSLRDFCYANWAHRDLAAAVARAESAPEKALPGLIRAVVESDLERGLSLLSRYPDVRGVAEAVLGKLAESDPAEALRLTETLPLAIKEHAIKAVLLAEAETDPESALAKAREVDLLGARTGIVNAIIARVAENNLARAERLVLTLPPSETRREAFSEFAHIRAREDPDRTLTWAKGLRDGLEKHTAVRRALQAMAQRSWKGDDDFEILEMLDELGWEYAYPNPEDRGYRSNGPDGAAVRAIKELARTDPQRALAYMAKLPGSKTGLTGSRAGAAGQVFTEWFDREPSEALAALENVPSEALRQSVMRKLVGSDASEESLQTMAEHLPHMEDDVMVNAGARIVAQRFARVDPMKAIDWVDTLPEEAQTQALASAISTFMEDHPDLAKEQIMRMEPGSERERYVSRMLSLLANENLDEALDWFDTLSPSDRHPETYMRLAGSLFEDDPQAAADWVARLPAGTSRDQAASAIALRLSRGETPDFSAAYGWSKSINDPVERERTLIRTLERWLAKGVAGARDAISQAPLGDEVKERLLTR